MLLTCPLKNSGLLMCSHLNHPTTLLGCVNVGLGDTPRQAWGSAQNISCTGVSSVPNIAAQLYKNK